MFKSVVKPNNNNIFHFLQENVLKFINLTYPHVLCFRLLLKTREQGVKDDRDFRISDLFKNPDWTDI